MIPRLTRKFQEVLDDTQKKEVLEAYILNKLLTTTDDMDNISEIELKSLQVSLKEMFAHRFDVEKLKNRILEHYDEI